LEIVKKVTFFFMRKLIHADSIPCLFSTCSLPCYIIPIVYAKYLDIHKINNTSCNYLGSFFIEKLSLKMHLINKKTAVHTTDPL
jgi:hypothetical protein